MGSKTEQKTSPKTEPNFGLIGADSEKKRTPNWPQTIALKLFLIGFLASSRPSWAILGVQQAFLGSSGSTVIASSFSWRVSGVLWGSSGGAFEFNPGPPFGHLDVLWVLLGLSLGLLQALHQPSSALVANSQRLRGSLHDFGLGGANLRKIRTRSLIRLKVVN